METQATVEVGSIFRCSWGYDQTNVDFYEVVKISTTGKTVTVRKLRQEMVSDNERGYTTVAPIPGTFIPEGAWNAETLVRRLKVGWQQEPGFAPESYSWASLWDGTPAYETGSGWGH